MCEHNSYDVPSRVVWKLSFWTVVIAIAFIVSLLTGPFSKLLAPRLSLFGSGASSTQQSDRSAQSSPSTDSSPNAGQPQSNMVWVDTETGIYHKSSAWMGDSAHTKRMTESDALRAGYHPPTSEYHRRF